MDSSQTDRPKGDGDEERTQKELESQTNRKMKKEEPGVLEKKVGKKIPRVADAHALDTPKLSKTVLKHIVSRHPEVAPYTNRIVDTVEKPDLIVRGSRDEFKALRSYSDLHIGENHLVVVYNRRSNERIIITAYFTSNIRKVKGELMWRKPQ